LLYKIRDAGLPSNRALRQQQAERTASENNRTNNNEIAAD
jgi:hypothetical protein